MNSRTKRLSYKIAAKEQPIRHESDNGLHIEYRLPSNNKLHNENGPAFIGYYDNGKKQYEDYWINGNCHNENGPAYISYYSNGNKEYEIYYINNNFHNENGPAIIGYYPNGKKDYERYWINDKYYSLQEFLIYKLNKIPNGKQLAILLEDEGLNETNNYAISDFLLENGYPRIAESVREEF